jgi:hypothetical protein
MSKPVITVQVGKGKDKQIYERCPNPEHSRLKLHKDIGCPECGFKGFIALGKKFVVLKKRRRKKTVTNSI